MHEEGTEWVAATTLSELAKRKKKLVSIHDEQIALFFVNGRAYALKDTCIHQQRSLSNGTVLRNRVICPGHQWAFDVETGWVEEQERCQPTYGVRIDGDTVYVNPQPRVVVEASE